MEWQFIVSAAIGTIALVLAILSYLDTKKIRREFDGSLGTPAVEIRWGKPNENGMLPFRVTAIFNAVSEFTVRIAGEEETADHLERGEGKELEVRSVPEGTKFKLSFTDPVDRQRYSRTGIVRYEQMDF